MKNTLTATNSEVLNANEKKLFGLVLSAIGITDGSEGFIFNAIEKPRPARNIPVEHRYQMVRPGLRIEISAFADYPQDFRLVVSRTIDEPGQVNMVDLHATIFDSGRVTINQWENSSQVYFSTGKLGGKPPQITIYANAPYKDEPLTILHNNVQKLRVPDVLQEEGRSNAERLIMLIRNLLES